MANQIVDGTAVYHSAAVEIYDAFRAMPTSTSVADDWNAMQAVVRAARGRTGLRIVDLGCGPGIRTREIAEMAGVSAVVGIDHSPEQLTHARAAAIPENCRFAFGDLVALGDGDGEWAACDSAASEADVEDLLGTFDVALMAFVTSHAATQAELDAMVRAAAAFLAPGGQLVVIDAHPLLNVAPFPACDQYAIRKTFVLPDGYRGAVPAFTAIRTKFVTPKGELTVEDYFHDVGSWSAAAAAAGLGGLVFEDYSAPPTPEPDFWDAYVRPDHPAGHSQAAVIRADKPARTNNDPDPRRSPMIKPKSPMIRPSATNREFELGGINHVALVCADMARTVEFYSGVLGMPLVKAKELPDGMGQHFFFDAGGGDCVAFFWFADAPDGEVGETVPAALPGVGDIVTAVGTMNHLAFHVPAERFDEYRQRLIDNGVAVGPVLNHDDSAAQVAEVLHPGVFIRSFYFTDPDGVMLEFACWTKEFSDEEPNVVGRTDAERRPRPHPGPTS